jgi:hypothetical protein
MLPIFLLRPGNIQLVPVNYLTFISSRSGLNDRDVIMRTNVFTAIKFFQFTTCFISFLFSIGIVTFHCIDRPCC